MHYYWLEGSCLPTSSHAWSVLYSGVSKIIILPPLSTFQMVIPLFFCRSINSLGARSSSLGKFGLAFLFWFSGS